MSFNVKCIRGPFWIPDDPEFKDYPWAEECFGYECLINGKRIVIAEENEDGFRYVLDADQKTYDLYTRNKKVLMPLIAKAIDEHILKSKLTDQTKETFGDLIDEL
jgi:hypothetical protein